MAAANVVTRLLGNRSVQVLDKIMAFARDKLVEYAQATHEARNPRVKDGVLALISACARGDVVWGTGAQLTHVPSRATCAPPPHGSSLLQLGAEEQHDVQVCARGHDHAARGARVRESFPVPARSRLLCHLLLCRD